MDYSLSEMQKMMKTEVRDFLQKECTSAFVRQMETDPTGYSKDLWRKMAEFGWMAIPFPEAYGGMGGSFLDLMVLVEEMGRANLPSPFIPTILLSGLTLLDSGNEAWKAEVLPKIITGETIGTMAVLEAGDQYDFSGIHARIFPTENACHIQGEKLFVPYAHEADMMVVAANLELKGSDGSVPSLFVVDAKNQEISKAPMENIAGEKLFAMHFDMTVPVKSELVRGEEAATVLRKAIEKAAIAKCAEMVGGAQRVLEMTLEYARNRKQFGHPIGSYQIIQHYCANMAVDLETSKWNTYHAAWLLSENRSATRQVAVAKAWTGEAYRRILGLGHQIHGAIAFTKELDVELYIRRGKAAEVAFGNAAFWRKVIARSIG